MKKFYRSVIGIATGLLFLSCAGNREASIYATDCAIVKTGANSNYFLSDGDIYLRPKGDVWDSKWGNEGDRVLVAFYYNPYTVSELSTSVSVDVYNVEPIPFQETALPSSVDTVNNGMILDFSDGSNQYRVSSWVARNWLTSHFYVRYSDVNSRHSFGYIEEPVLYGRDTLFLRLWHKTGETGKSSIADALVSLNLNGYKNWLSSADSTVISIKYRAEGLAGNESEKTSYAVYKRYSDNPFGI